MTLTGNIRKYWTLRKTGKQEPSRRQSIEKKTSIISMEYPSSYQIFGNQYYEKAKQRKQPPKLQHHQTESTQVRNQRQRIRNDLKNILILCKHINTTHTHSHTLPDDGRTISRNVAEKSYNSRHDKLRKQYTHSSCHTIVELQDSDFASDLRHQPVTASIFTICIL